MCKQPSIVLRTKNGSGVWLILDTVAFDDRKGD